MKEKIKEVEGSTALSKSLGKEALALDQQIYFKWDNINYYVPAKSDEINKFNEKEEQEKLKKKDNTKKGKKNKQKPSE